MVAEPTSTAAQTPAAHPPTLTARDAILLQNLFALGRSLFALASHHNLPLPDLIDWLSQPHIQAARDLIARELAEGLKSEALEILRQIARTSEDPVERRRATTQILRALNPPQPRRPRPDAPPSPPNGAAHGSEHTPVQRTPTVNEGPSSPSDDPAAPTSDALAHLAAAKTFRSQVLNTYGPTLDEALDAEDDDAEDDDEEDAGLADLGQDEDEEEDEQDDDNLSEGLAATCPAFGSPPAEPPPAPGAHLRSSG